MTPAELAQAQEAAQAFSPGGRLLGVEPLHRGHIHDTFISSWDLDGVRRRLLHQRMNDAVFQDIPGLMHNIRRVTRELRKGSWRARDRELEVQRRKAKEEQSPPTNDHRAIVVSPSLRF